MRSLGFPAVLIVAVLIGIVLPGLKRAVLGEHDTCDLAAALHQPLDSTARLTEGHLVSFHHEHCRIRDPGDQRSIGHPQHRRTVDDHQRIFLLHPLDQLDKLG